MAAVACCPLSECRIDFKHFIHSAETDRWRMTVGLGCVEGNYIRLCAYITLPSTICAVHWWLLRHLLADKFDKDFKEKSLLLPPISILARGIHSNWKSKRKVWGLRRIGKTRREGLYLPDKDLFQALNVTERVSKQTLCEQFERINSTEMHSKGSP